MQKNKHKKIFHIVVGLLLIVFLNLIQVGPVRAADTTGRITGQLQDGSNGNAPLAGQEVILQKAQGESAQNLATAVTDAQGKFRFDDLATDQTISYAVYMRYQGAHYVSDLVNLASDPTPEVNLVVYQASSNSDKMLVGRLTVLVNEPDVHTKTVTISEIFSFTNLDTHAYVGSLDASQGKPNALRFSLPDGAHEIVLGKGFSGYEVIQVDRGFASDVAVLPGDNEFSFTYKVPYTERTLDLNYTLVYPTLSISFMVPPDIHFSSELFQPADVVNSGDDQRPYNLFTAERLTEGTEIQYRLEGLYLFEDNTSWSLSPAVIWLLVMIGLMLAILASTWLFLRSARKAQTARVQRKKKGRPTRQDVEDEEQELLQQLLQLDKAHEAGTLEEPAYQERRKKARARLRTLMREQEALRG